MFCQFTFKEQEKFLSLQKEVGETIYQSKSSVLKDVPCYLAHSQYPANIKYMTITSSCIISPLDHDKAQKVQQCFPAVSTLIADNNMNLLQSQSLCVVFNDKQVSMTAQPHA